MQAVCLAGHCPMKHGEPAKIARTSLASSSRSRHVISGINGSGDDGVRHRLTGIDYGWCDDTTQKRSLDYG